MNYLLIAIAAANLSSQTLASTLRLATHDTVLAIQPRDSGLSVVSLRHAGSGWNWANPNGAEIPFIATVEEQGLRHGVRWQLVRDVREPGRIEYLFQCAKPQLGLRSIWEARPGPGPIEHTITISNMGSDAVTLPLQPSLRFDARAPHGHSLVHWWVEKGGGAPTDAGAHHEPIAPGYARELDTLPYSEDNQPRDAIPWSAIQDGEGAQGFYTGIEFSGRVTTAFHALPDAAGHAAGVRVELGLTPEAGYRTVLLPGETFRAPTVFIGCYEGGVDDGANRLRRWVAGYLRPPVREAKYPLLTLNSWGSGMAVDEALAGRMIDDGAALGLENFHVDAGWFRSVGDWRPNPAKFPRGLAVVADRALAKGMRFGLWVGWTQGGIAPDGKDRQRILNVFAPDRMDWFARRYTPDWKPADFTGADLCLSDPAAQDWCIALLDRLVRECRLDMLEHDQRMIVDTCMQVNHPHTESRTDIAYAAANGYYRIYDAIRARHPNLLFEDCVNGGRTVDYGIVRRVHYISITDTYNPLANRRAFYDASFALPAAMCECYIENEKVASMAEFRTMLRSGMMGWCTIMCDTNAWTAEQHAAARRQFEIYKRWLRPLINDSDLYHLTERPDGRRWDAIQYADRSGDRAVIMAFRGSAAESRHTFRLHGLDPSAPYIVRFEDGKTPERTVSGPSLMSAGIEVELEGAGSSQVVYVRRKQPTPHIRNRPRANAFKCR